MANSPPIKLRSAPGSILEPNYPATCRLRPLSISMDPSPVEVGVGMVVDNRTTERALYP
jgi:hypothetical protein